MKIGFLDHLVLTVRDIDASVKFYTQMLGMQLEEFEAADGINRYALKFGSQKINLHEAGHEFEPKSALPTPGSADLCFQSLTPVKEWIDVLNRQGTSILEGPVARTGATGPLISIYLRDPDGNLIEISNPASRSN